MWKSEVHLCLRDDTLSFHPVHTQIRAIGPRVLHHKKGRGLRVSTVGTDHLLCLSDEEVDLCHAGACSEHISLSVKRREAVDTFLWQVQKSMLPSVHKRHGKKRLKRFEGA